jgi:hypothetical protein
MNPEDMPFDYQITKAGKVLIYWQGKLVTTLAGKPAQKFQRQIAGLDDPAAQIVLARFTGNFKRGNEREGKHKNE